MCRRFVKSSRDAFWLRIRKKCITRHSLEGGRQCGVCGKATLFVQTLMSFGILAICIIWCTDLGCYILDKSLPINGFGCTGLEEHISRRRGGILWHCGWLFWIRGCILIYGRFAASAWVVGLSILCVRNRPNCAFFDGVRFFSINNCLPDIAFWVLKKGRGKREIQEGFVFEVTNKTRPIRLTKIYQTMWVRRCLWCTAAGWTILKGPFDPAANPDISISCCKWQSCSKYAP